MVKSCTNYQDDVQMDTKWRIAAIFSILPIVVGGIDFLFIAVKKCTVNHVFDCLAFILAFFFSVSGTHDTLESYIQTHLTIVLLHI